MLAYRNGYAAWLWSCKSRSKITSDEGTTAGDTEDERPGFKYTSRTEDNKTRNGGWSGQGVTKYNSLFDLVEKDREENSGVFDEAFQKIRKGSRKRRRDSEDGGNRSRLNTRDELDSLLAAS